MRVSLNWLKDYLDIKPDADVEQLCQSLTLAGLEVEGIEHLSEYDDVVITLGITPNRADALSHLGISRELAAALDLSTRSPMLSLKEMAGPIHEKIAIEIEDAEDCPRYAIRVIENVKIEESPEWLRMRLLACGIRPVNNIVDVTNYVMLARGQPMHAFDYDKLAKDGTRVKMHVRRARADEKLEVLDGKVIELSPQDVVIADASQALALAGVIGGKKSAISSDTTTIVLESAYFEPKNVRLSSRKFGIITDSSYRFERGTDPNGVVDALNYAARLIVEMGEAKACREAIDAYRKRIDPLEIHMRPERAQAVLGISAEDFDQDTLRRKFLRLGIETVAKRGDAIYFRVPSFRSDLQREIDLIEEAARMIGYDKVNESTIGNSKEAHLFVNSKYEATIKKLRGLLVARGFFESVNYAFLNKDYQQHFINDSDELIEVMNPLSERYGVMRRSLIPGLIKNVQHNQRNQENNIQLFEIGTVFLGKRSALTKPEPNLLSATLDQDSYAFERQKLAGVMTGFGTFSAFDQAPKARDFYHLKGVMSECFKALGLDDNTPHGPLSFRHGAGVPFLHPGESLSVLLNDQVIGHFGKVHPNVAVACDVTGEVFVFEFDLLALSEHSSTLARYQPFSRFPGISRDVAMLVNESVLIGDIIGLVHEVDKQHQKLVKVNVFDIYRGKNIETGKKSVAISLTLQDKDRTLLDDDADRFVTDFLTQAELKTGAVVRK